MQARATSRIVSAALAVAVAFGAAALPAAAAPDSGPTPGGQLTVPPSPNGRYLVQYADRADFAAETQSLRAEGVSVRRTFGRALKTAVVSANRAEAQQLAKDPQVVAVEPDMRIRTSYTQSNAPWGLDRVDQRTLPLNASYTAPASGQGVKVYVMDTGVLADHAELRGRVGSGWSAVADGLGTGDCNGHGTHVAGTVAGSVYGIAKSATIVPVRVLDCQGAGYGSDLLAGLDWVVNNHSAGDPAVLNMSLGSDSTSSIIDDAVREVMGDGVLAVVAAGNAAKDACLTSPGRVTEALTVAASDQGDLQTSFSNYGQCVDLYAPGYRIVSASHTSTTGLAMMSGTSMSTPHVAGAAAVLLSQRPDLAPSQVAAQLNADATPNVISNVTAGTPNRLLYLAGAAVPAPQPAPSSPDTSYPDTGSEPQQDPVPGDGSVTQPEPEPEVTRPGRSSKPRAMVRRRAAAVTWVQGDDGGSPITKQIVRVYRGPKRVGLVRVPGHVTRVKVTGLEPRKVYRFTVIQRNSAGKSPQSAKSNKVRPRR